MHSLLEPAAVQPAAGTQCRFKSGFEIRVVHPYSTKVLLAQRKDREGPGIPGLCLSDVIVFSLQFNLAK